MKKISRLFCVMIMSLLLVVPFVNVDAAKTTKKTTTTTTTAQTYAVSQDENAVTIHVFYLPTCEHCQHLHEFLAELKEDKDYKDKFNVKDYSVQDSLSMELLDEVRDYFKSTSGGVPYYVIGDQDYEGFGVGKSEAEIKKAIDDLYGSKNYKDVVAAIDNGNLDSLNDDSSNVIGMVVLGLCVVIIIVLIVCSSKNKYYEDDEEDEDTEEETDEEEVKEEPKKEETKKEETSKNQSKSNSSKKKSNAKKTKK